jgi:hypothetical protein
VMCDHTRGRRGVALPKLASLLSRYAAGARSGLTAAATDHVTLPAPGGEEVDTSIRCLSGPGHEIVTAEEFGLKQRVTIGVDGGRFRSSAASVDPWLRRGTARRGPGYRGGLMVRLRCYKFEPSSRMRPAEGFRYRVGQ